MSDKQKKKRSFLKSFLIKLPWLIVFCAVFLILSLKVVERFPQPLKEGFENYFASVSGQQVSISQLEKMTFFPEIYVRINDMVFSDAMNVALTNMSVGSAKVHIPFLNMFGMGSNIYGIHVQDLKAQKGILTPQDIHVNELDIVDMPDDETLASLVLTGTYASQNLMMQVQLERKNTLLGRVVYRVPDIAKIDLNIGDIHLRTDFSKGGKGIWFKNGILTVNDDINNVEDSALFSAGEIQADNIMACLLEHDYKGVGKICESHIKDKQ